MEPALAKQEMAGLWCENEWAGGIKDRAALSGMKNGADVGLCQDIPQELIKDLSPVLESSNTGFIPDCNSVCASTEKMEASEKKTVSLSFNFMLTLKLFRKWLLHIISI